VTVFQISTAGTGEGVVLTLTGGGTGNTPYGGLIDVGGTLYGTTSGGGASNRGTVFSLSQSGTEKVLRSFMGGTDGAHPEATLLNVNGTLYGTTTAGGGTGCGGAGCGTVFKLRP
jgi:uncharacterized repeat protein (TIGR03803 family)